MRPVLGNRGDKGDKADILTYEGGIDEFDKYLLIIKQMVNSFQITKIG